MGWLLKHYAGSFFQQYSAYSQQVLLDCIAAINGLIEQCERGRVKQTLVHRLLQALSEIISPVLDEAHKIRSAAKDQESVPLLPLAASAATECPLLPVDQYLATSNHTSSVCNTLEAPPAVPLSIAMSQVSSCTSATLPSPVLLLPFHQQYTLVSTMQLCAGLQYPSQKINKTFLLLLQLCPYLYCLLTVPSPPPC